MCTTPRSRPRRPESSSCPSRAPPWSFRRPCRRWPTCTTPRSECRCPASAGWSSPCRSNSRPASPGCRHRGVAPYGGAGRRRCTRHPVQRARLSTEWIRRRLDNPRLAVPSLRQRNRGAVAVLVGSDCGTRGRRGARHPSQSPKAASDSSVCCITPRDLAVEAPAVPTQARQTGSNIRVGTTTCTCRCLINQSSPGLGH